MSRGLGDVYKRQGFAFMEAFMDELEVESIPGKGTRVHMWKKMRCGDWIGKED